MSWEFAPLDEVAFPAVALAKEAAASSSTHMAVFNAANEQAVTAFHRGALAFTEIVSTVENILERHEGNHAADVGAVLEAEAWARAETDQLVGVTA